MKAKSRSNILIMHVFLYDLYLHVPSINRFLINFQKKTCSYFVYLEGEYGEYCGACAECDVRIGKPGITSGDEPLNWQ